MLFFICHYTPLHERNTFIRKELDSNVGNMLYYNLPADDLNNNVPIHDFSKNNIDISMNTALFVRKYDRNYIDKSFIDKMYLSQYDKSHNIRLEFVNHENYNTNLLTYENFKSKHNHSLNQRGNKPAEISLALKHYEALRNITTMDVSYAMIIEDDCVFTEKFIEKLNERIKLFPNDWDIYYPNSCPNPGFRTKGGYTPIQGTDHIAIKNHPTSVFGISYLITKTAAIKIVEDIDKNKLWLPIDHELSWLSYKLQLRVIWNSQSPRLTFWNTSGFKSSLL